MSASPHAVVQDLAASWVAYLEALSLLERRAPDGLQMLVAGPTDEGIRAISLWRSQADWERFHDDRLRALLESMEPAQTLQATSRQLVVKHLLVLPLPAQA